MSRFYLFLLLIFEITCLVVGNRKTKIFGGIDADIKEVPYYVLIVLSKPDGNHSICGGTIIGKKWILTAAHCLCYRTEEDSNKCSYLNKNGTTIFTDEDNYEPEEFIVHDEFGFDHSQNDIALVKLSRELDYNDKVKPLRIIAKSPNEWSVLRIAGYGLINEQGDLAKELQAAYVPVLDRETCEAQFGKLSETQFCAGTKKMHTCRGDSGGPAVTISQELAGVTSWGLTEYCTDGPRVFTNVASYRPWILQHFNFLENDVKDYFKRPSEIIT